MTMGRPITQLAVGDSAELSRQAKAKEIAEFVTLVGDSNPVHSDAMFMGQTPFQEPIVPGMWTAALISAVIGNRLPGPGSIYAAQELKFLRPVKVRGGRLPRGWRSSASAEGPTPPRKAPAPSAHSRRSS